MKLLSKYVALFVFALGLTCHSVFAQDIDLEAGQAVFSANCAACHAGGNNAISPEKTLKLEALQKNGKDTIDAITYQVTNGYNAMPAFGGRLSDEDIVNVANFVLNQAKTDSW